MAKVFYEGSGNHFDVRLTKLENGADPYRFGVSVRIDGDYVAYDGFTMSDLDHMRSVLYQAMKGARDARRNL